MEIDNFDDSICNQTDSERLAPLLDTCRVVTLMFPLAIEFGDIPMIGSGARIAVIGRVISKAVDMNDALLTRVRESGAIPVLREEAMRRQSGEIAFPKFLTTLGDESREGAR